MQQSDCDRVLRIIHRIVGDDLGADLVVPDSIRAGVTVMAKTIASDLAPYDIAVNNLAPGALFHCPNDA